MISEQCLATRAPWFFLSHAILVSSTCGPILLQTLERLSYFQFQHRRTPIWKCSHQHDPQISSSRSLHREPIMWLGTSWVFQLPEGLRWGKATIDIEYNLDNLLRINICFRMPPKFLLTKILELNLQDERQRSKTNCSTKCQEKCLRRASLDDTTEFNCVSGLNNLVVVRLHIWSGKNIGREIDLKSFCSKLNKTKEKKLYLHAMISPACWRRSFPPAFSPGL